MYIEFQLNMFMLVKADTLPPHLSSAAFQQ